MCAGQASRQCDADLFHDDIPLGSIVFYHPERIGTSLFKAWIDLEDVRSVWTKTRNDSALADRGE